MRIDETAKNAKYGKDSWWWKFGTTKYRSFYIWSFQINGGVTKNELFDIFIYEFILSFFWNYLNTQDIW